MDIRRNTPGDEAMKTSSQVGSPIHPFIHPSSSLFLDSSMHSHFLQLVLRSIHSFILPLACFQIHQFIHPSSSLFLDSSIHSPFILSFLFSFSDSPDHLYFNIFHFFCHLFTHSFNISFRLFFNLSQYLFSSCFTFFQNPLFLELVRRNLIPFYSRRYR